jgi:hypothetical protein
MSQHDQNIANDTGGAVRGDLNNALAALFGVSSGATAPATTIAYQFWADTTSGLLKQRNAANTSWLVRGTLAETIAISRSSDTILAAGDYKKFFQATASFTQTLTAAATLGDGWYVFYRVQSGATVTIDPNSTEQIDGATTKVLVGPTAGVIFCDGAAFRSYGYDTALATTTTTGVVELATQAEMDAGTASKVPTTDLNKIALGTPIATTSGTAHDFTGIPAGTRRITIMLKGVSLSGAENYLIQVGDAGGIETSGYLGASARLNNGGNAVSNYTAGFGINVAAGSNVIHGSIILSLEDAASFTWTASGIVGYSDGAETVITAGSKSLSAELTQLRLTQTGVNTFDAGSVNISYER